MSIETEAIYENGTLKLEHSLPLEEHQRVRIIIEPKRSIASQCYGIIGWRGDPEVVRKAALDPEAGVLGSP